MKNIPEVGKEYYFFDDGKISPSRCYKAKVVKVIPYNESDQITLRTYDRWAEDYTLKSLHDIHKETVDEHKSEEGEPWLYSEDTDFFIECSIPGYDENNLFFARTIHGGWFSMDIQSSWQAGSLDVDGEIYQDAKEYFDDSRWYGWYDSELQEKGELICQK